MVHAWGGFSNGQIPLSAMRQVQGQYFEPDMADRMDYLLSQVSVHINEGYRPLGIESDQYVTNEAQTSTGGSNQWFQWGRYKRGETPSAGTPGTSSHGWGLAADINPGRGHANVEAVCAQLGLIFTVPSESWHVAADGTPTVNYKKTSIRNDGQMYLVQKSSTAHVFTIAPGYLHHVSSGPELAVITKVLGGQPVVGYSDADLQLVFASFGVPWDKWQAVSGGKTWSRELETQQMVQAGGGSGASPAAIAKAVNDDAAKRMSS